MKHESLYILAITDQSDKPDESCIIETFLHEVNSNLQEYQQKLDPHKIYQQKDQDNEQENDINNHNIIKIVKIDKKDIENVIMNRKEREYLSQGTPKILVCKKDKCYNYIGELKKGLFLSFINRLITPYVTLDQDEQITNFLNASLEFKEEISINNTNRKFSKLINYLASTQQQESYHTHKQKFRGLLILYDRSYNPQIMRQYQQACEKLAIRDDLRMGFIGDRSKVISFLNKYDERLGFNGSKNILLIVSDSENFKFIDLEQYKDLDIEEWINKNSIDYVQEIRDVKDAKLISQIKTPKFILFLDESQKSHHILNHVHMLAGSYHTQLTFTYVIDPNLIDIRYELGSSQLNLPAATIVTNQGVIYPFREDQFNTETLDSYVKSFLTGRIRPLNNEKFLATIDTFCDKLLQHTKFISITAFNQTVLDTSDKDILVYFYSSEKDSWANRKSQEHASYIDSTSQRLKDHNFKTVEVMSYDTYRYGLPNHMINGIEVPSLYLYPANDKSNPVKYSEQFHKVRTHMEFVEKYGSTGIKLDERSHLPSRLVTVQDVKQPGSKHYDPRIKFDDL